MPQKSRQEFIVELVSLPGDNRNGGATPPVQIQEKLSAQWSKPWVEFFVYFILLFGFAIVFLGVQKGHKLSPFGDHGIMHYAIIHNLQKFEHGDFKQWTNQRIFYPNTHTMAYTEHFYVHSLIGAPYYFLTRDPLDTYVFIFLAQLSIAITGYYFFARKLTGSIIAIILSGMYFVYLPAFYEQHPHINFYGFLPWFFYFLIRLLETGKIKFVYFSALAFLLQAAVGIYFQLFMMLLSFGLVLLIGAVLYFHAERRNILSRKLFFHALLSFSGVVFILLLINQPYIQFKNMGQVRPIHLVMKGSAQALGYFVPNSPQDSTFYPFSFLKDLILEDKKIFLGRTGTLTILASILVALLSPFGGAHFLKNNKRILGAALFLIGFFWILSLGPVMKLGNSELNLPYYYLYKANFIFRSIRVPSRFIVLMALPISVLILWWYEEFKMRRIPRVLKAAGIVFFGFMLWKDIYRPWRYPTYFYVYNELFIYDRLNRTPGDVLLQLPSKFSAINLKPGDHWHFRDDSFYMFMHLYHKKWMINGEAGPFPENATGIIRQIDTNYSDSSKLKRILEKNNISTILIHFNRIDKNYLRNYDVLIRQLLPLSRIVYKDRNYLLLSMNGAPTL